MRRTERLRSLKGVMGGELGMGKRGDCGSEIWAPSKSIEVSTGNDPCGLTTLSVSNPDLTEADPTNPGS